MAWSIPCGSEGRVTLVSHLKVGGQEFFNQNMREGQHFLLEKIPKFPSPPPPRKNVPSLTVVSLKNITQKYQYHSLAISL